MRTSIGLSTDAVLLSAYHNTEFSKTDILFSCTFHALGPVVCSESELTSESMNPFRHFGRTPWTGYQPVARPVPTQNSTTQKDVDMCIRKFPD